MSRKRPELTAIRFGTDGWRAVIANEFTFDNVERVAQAYADYLQQQSAQTEGRRVVPSVVVGYDRRFMSEQFAVRAAEVLAGNQIRVALFDTDVPTPLVSWAVRDQKAAGGVVITASHNPPLFNGFKIKAPWGGSATPEMTVAVETLVDANQPRRGELRPRANETLASTSASSQIASASSASAPAASHPQDALPASVESYRAQVASYVDLERIRATKARVVVDPMHGAGGRWVESFLAGGALEVETIRADRDTLFGGVAPEPIDRNLAPLKSRVTERGALVGLATDGDADRVGAVGDTGETMTMHEVVPLILLHLARRRGMTGGIVRTFSQSVLLKRIAAAHNLPLYETPIGFKYIADLMLREKILIGAEESGGIGVQGHIPERDGILNSLLLLEAVVMAGKPPTELVREMHAEFGEFYFGRRDLHMQVASGLALVSGLATEPPTSVAGEDVQGVERLDGTKLLFADESWLLFRQSGTEPVLRIYAEATSQTKMNALLEQGCAFARTLREGKS